MEKHTVNVGFAASNGTRAAAVALWTCSVGCKVAVKVCKE